MTSSFQTPHQLPRQHAARAAVIVALLFGLAACAPVGQTTRSAEGDAASNAAAPGPLAIGLPAGCEDNTMFSCARRLEAGEAMTATPRGQERYSGAWKRSYFAIEPQQSGVLEIAIDPMPRQMHAGIAVYDARQNQIDSKQNFENGQSLFYDLPVREGERYYIGTGVLGDSTTYELSTSLDTGDIYEVNDQFSDAKEIAFGESVEAKMKPTGDEDIFRFEVSEPGPVEVLVEQVPAGVAMGVAVYDSRQQRISIDRGTGQEGGQSLAHSFEAPSAGTYYVKAFGSGRSDDFYRMQLHRVSE